MKYTKIATKIQNGHGMHQNGNKIPTDHEIFMGTTFSILCKAFRKIPKFCYENIPLGNSGANPTIASYNASVVNFYNATSSLARFKNKNIFF
jgi:hypothetical protein